MRATFVSALLLAIAAPAFAQPGAPDAARVVAATYRIDSNHSQVIWSVNHQGFTEYSGQFVQPTGTLTLDPAHPDQAKVEVTFPIDKLQTPAPALDTHLKSPDFFDAAKFPEGKFVSTRVVAQGTSATIEGMLTLKGVAKPVTLKARFYGAGKSRDGKANVGFQATTDIKRSDWGISFAVPGVSDAVHLVINAGFVQQ